MMKMQKILLASSLCGAFGLSFAADYAELDIIVRDFAVTHPDFENFQEEASANMNPSWAYQGYVDDANWQNKRNDNRTFGCGNEQNRALGLSIGMDGWPVAEANLAISTLPDYLKQKVSAVGGAEYGEYNFQGKKYRGLKHEAPGGANFDWAQPVMVTPGMVAQQLQFNPALGDDMMYEPIIVKNRDACDNQFFDQWYSDNNSFAKRTNMVLQLPKVEGTTNQYEVDYNWNNGGYFPLDSLDPSGIYVGPKSVPSYSVENGQVITKWNSVDSWGPQSLSIFCPPYAYKYADTQKDYLGNSTFGLCQSWLKNGGPRNPNAAVAAAGEHGALGMLHLRNYGFTMMGYAKFKYKKGGGEIFEFAGDDDMWIYVDGVLAVDLGGTHLAAPGKADMDFLSSNGHGCHPGEPLAGNTASGENCDLDEASTWKDGSWHHLHFFYADRQTDGSNMRIKSSLSELAPSRYGMPVIGEVTITPVEGEWVTSLVLNTKLSDQTVAAIQAAAAAGGKDVAAIIVRRPVFGPDGSIIDTEVYVYGMTSFEFGADKGSSGVVYKMTGALYKVNADGTIDYSNPVLPQSGDEFSFNYPMSDPTMEGYIKGVTDHPWILANQISSSAGLSTNGPSWSGSQLKAAIDDNFKIVDKTIDRPTFNVDGMLANSGKSAGDELPKNATGEMLISFLPKAAGDAPNGVDGWMNEGSAMCPGMTNQQCYSRAFGIEGQNGIPSERDGAWMFLKNSANNQNAYCYTDGKGVESCASISFWTSRPFQVNVRVFDHLGHFISQYTESISAEQMKELAMSAQGVANIEGAGTCAQKPTFSGAFVSVKLYPISQNGRKVGSGPYIYQVALIKETWSMDGITDRKPYCFYYASASSPVGEEAYARSSFSQTLGYRRSKN